MPRSTTVDGPPVVQRTRDADGRDATPSGRQGASALARLLAAVPRAKRHAGADPAAARSAAAVDPGHARAVAAARTAG